MRRSLIVLMLGAALPAQAAAEGWTVAPNGTATFGFNYTTTGFFRCQTHRFLEGTCEARGSSVVIGSTAGTMTLTFTGVSGSLVATNYGQPVALGTLVTTVEGDFVLPILGNPDWTLLTFTGLIHTVPVLPRSGVFGAGYFRSGSILASAEQKYGYGVVGFELPPNPSGASHDMLVFESVDMPHLVLENRQYELQSTFSLVPEPGTIGLFATGLLALGAVGLRRRGR